MDNISVRLKTIMSLRNLKQIDIIRKAQPYCDQYGVSLKKNDLSQYVNNKSAPGQKKLFILAITLDVSEAWLMGYDVPMNRTCNDSDGYLLSDHEKELIRAYRSQPSLQLAVDRTLGISDEDSDKKKKRA